MRTLWCVTRKARCAGFSEPLASRLSALARGTHRVSCVGATMVELRHRKKAAEPVAPVSDTETDTEVDNNVSDTEEKEKKEKPVEKGHSKGESKLSKLLNRLFFGTALLFSLIELSA